MSPRLLLFPLLVLAAGGGLYLASRPGGERPAPVPGPPPVPAPPAPGPEGTWHPEPVRIETLPRTESIPARVRAPKEIVITCDLPSPFVEIPVREGTAVKSGDLLARVNDEPFRKAVEAAAKAGDGEAERKARALLAATELRAPGDGIVFRLDARLGEMPPRGKTGPRPAVTLFDWTALFFVGTARGAAADLLRGGARVFVVVPGDRLTEAKATLVGEPGPDGAVTVEARPLQPPQVAPAPDSGAEIRVLSGDREALVVPAAAIRLEDGQAVVYRVTVTETLERRPVFLGDALRGGRVEISGAGVSRSDSVAVWESAGGKK